MPAFRSVVSVLSRELGDFLYLLKAGPAGGRLWRPSSAGSTTTAAGDPASRRTYPAVSLRRGLVSLTDAGFGRRAWSSRNRSTRPRNTTAIVKSLAWHHCLSRSYCSTERRVGTVCHGPPALNCGEKGLNRSSASDAAGME
jgi:hypothetical protein